MKSQGILAVLAAAALAGCADDLTNEVTVTADGNTSFMAYSTRPAEATGSRSVVTDANDGSDDIVIQWTSGDEVGVIGSAGTVNARFHSTLGAGVMSPQATFTGDLKQGETPAVAYYPYAADAARDYAATGLLKGTVPDEQKFYTSTGEIDSDYKVGTPNGDGSFTFDHILSFIRLDVKDLTEGHLLTGDRLDRLEITIGNAPLAGDFTFNPLTRELGGVTATSASSKIAVVWPEQPEITAESFVGYMTVCPVSLKDQGITITLHTDRHWAFVEVSSLKIDALAANTYYTLPIHIGKVYDNMVGDGWQIHWNEGKEPLAEGLYKPALSSSLDCANWGFALPGNEMMHKIRIDGATDIRVSELPQGLEWNSARNLVTGTAPTAPGDYYYLVEWTAKDGTAMQEGVKFTVSSALHQPTPHMGWQSWNVLEKSISESAIKEIADAMVNNKYLAAGYKWLGIDDCWQKSATDRDASTHYPIIDSTKFPNGLKTVTDYIHSKGMKAGIYSDAGPITCEGYLASYDHEAIDAKAFTEWGFDKLKEDWFWHDEKNALRDNNGKLDPASTTLAYDLYKRMGDGIKTAGGKILLSMCEWGIHEPWKWGPEAGASSWRISYDHRDGWMGSKTKKLGLITQTVKNDDSTNGDGCGIGLFNTIHLMRDLWPWAGVNRFNDPDMLVVGIRGTGRSSNDLVYSDYKGKMGDAEYETEFAMWCMWSAPLLITADVRRTDLNDHDVKLLKNADLIALDQDLLGQQAEYIKADGNVWYFCKDLAGGDVAIAAVNLGDSQADYKIDYKDYDALSTTGHTFSGRKLIGSGADAITLAPGSASATGSLAAHATVVYRLTKQ